DADSLAWHLPCLCVGCAQKLVCRAQRCKPIHAWEIPHGLDFGKIAKFCSFLVAACGNGHF
ncbi:hypothetical protein ACQP3J_27670, partial [Escherichia coli]